MLLFRIISFLTNVFLKKLIFLINFRPVEVRVRSVDDCSKKCLITEMVSTGLKNLFNTVRSVDQGYNSFF